MDNLEGMLMVPPERGQILGRAVWKVPQNNPRRNLPILVLLTDSDPKSCDMLSWEDVTQGLVLLNHSRYLTVAITALEATDLSPNYL